MPLGTRILTPKPAPSGPVGQPLFEDDLETNVVDQQTAPNRTVALGQYLSVSAQEDLVFYDLGSNQFRPNSGSGVTSANVLLLDQATDNDRMAIELGMWLSASEDTNWMQARLFSNAAYNTNPRLILIYDRQGANASKYRYVIRTVDDTNGAVDHYTYDSDQIINGEPVRFEVKLDSASQATLAFRLRDTVLFGPTQVAFDSTGIAKTRAMVRTQVGTVSVSYARVYGYDRLDAPIDNVIRVDNKNILIP